MQLFAVKMERTREDKIELMEVGLKEESKIGFRECTVTLPPTKFASTTYNNEGARFHLVVCVYTETDGPQPMMLGSRISPSIFVDSRKTEPELQKAKTLLSHYEPFPPDVLGKSFIKRKCKDEDQKEVEVKSDSQGLINYFTAPNIRKKVKHPLFLALRFPGAVTLAYNYNHIKTDAVLWPLALGLTLVCA